jgi:hypothetical protein
VSTSARSVIALALIGAMQLTSACGTLRKTERVFDGQLVEGHYIEPEAYAAYVQGAYHEARAEWSQAERAYRRALRSDGQSPQLWTRLGALACRDSLPRAQEHFERALAIEAFAPAWTERARCLALQQRTNEALAAALEGARLDPRGASSNLLVVRLYREASQPTPARSWLFGWLLLEPELETYAAELEHESTLLADDELTALTAAALQRHEGRGRSALPAEPLAPNTAPQALMAAIRSGELERARTLASEARLSPLQLATLALETGRADLALEQAELLVRANPRDPAALITGLLAAALHGDSRRFRELLRQTRSDELPSSELARLLSGLLRTRAGEDAAQAWDTAYLRERTSRPAPP